VVGGALYVVREFRSTEAISKVAGTYVEQIPNTKAAGGYDTWKRE